MSPCSLAHTTQIEIVVGGAKAAEVAPPAKTLTERITQPKAQPKSAANNKKKEVAGKAAASSTQSGRGGKRRPRSVRPAKKTTEELDSEMADYFESGNQPNENTNGGAPAAANGDAPMDDEII